MGHMYATITAKGQITLPVAARRALGLREGQKVEVRVEGNSLVIEAPPPDIAALRQRLRTEGEALGTWGGPFPFLVTGGRPTSGSSTATAMPVPTLDTNILLRWLLDDAPAQTTVVNSLLETGIRCTIPDAALIETTFVLEATLRYPRPTVVTTLKTILPGPVPDRSCSLEPPPSARTQTTPNSPSLTAFWPVGQPLVAIPPRSTPSMRNSRDNYPESKSHLGSDCAANLAENLAGPPTFGTGSGVQN